MLEKEYQRIYMQTLIEWRAYLDVGRHLYTKYIPKDSQFTNVYFNEVLPTFDGIGKLFSQSSQNFIAYDLNPEYLERWQWVVNTLRSK